MSDSLWPHGLQNAWLPCLSPTPRVHPNPCPLSRWCHPTISSSVIPFSSFCGERAPPRQRSWGRRLGIRKGGIEPQESPWKSSSIYPHNQSLPTLLLCALTYTSDFTGAYPPPPLLENLELQLIIIPGHDRSVSTYKLLWRFSSLPDRLVRPHVIAHSLPTVRGTRCFKPSKNRFFREVRKLLV